MKRTILSAAVLALAIGGTGIAAADKPADAGSQGGYKVTGGGQIIADASGGGAGDTVGFNAHRLSDDGAAKGQFQYVPRGESAGTAQEATEKFHGIVTCLISGSEAQANEQAEETDEDDSNDGVNEGLMPGSARFGGYLRDNPGQFFTVDVTDNGQGGAAEDDAILVRLTSEPCGDNPENEENEPEDLLKLGRGNVKIHNNVDGESSPAEAAAASASLLRAAL